MNRIVCHFSCGAASAVWGGCARIDSRTRSQIARDAINAGRNRQTGSAKDLQPGAGPHEEDGCRSCSFFCDSTNRLGMWSG